MTMEFRCNLKCVHCMIEDTMDRLQPQSSERFDELLAFNSQHNRWQGLILTGSEITLHHDLPDLAQRARSAGFEKVRIQTHGMHLDKRHYLDNLIKAGVNEYFVSVAGEDAQTHDRITTVSGSFARTLEGLENIDRYPDAISITNTVVTRNCYRGLPALVRKLGHLRNLKQMEFWNYWPMEETDSKALIAPVEESLPYLREAIILAKEMGRRVEIKNFPKCLLGDLGECLVNAQPQLFIDADFWKEFERNGFYQCAHREQCSAEDCLGLNEAYIRKFGDEANLLSPL